MCQPSNKITVILTELKLVARKPKLVWLLSSAAWIFIQEPSEDECAALLKSKYFFWVCQYVNNTDFIYSNCELKILDLNLCSTTAQFVLVWVWALAQWWNFWCVSMLETTVATEPQFSYLLLTVLPQTRVLGIYSLTLGGKFIVQNPTNVKENHQQALSFASDLTRPPQSRRLWALSLWDCCLVFSL